MILGALAFAAAAIVELKIEVSSCLQKGTDVFFLHKCRVFPPIAIFLIF